MTAVLARRPPWRHWRFPGCPPIGSSSWVSSPGRGRLKPVLDNAAAVRATLVAFESPARAGHLAEMAALRPGCRLALCRELTKLHEQVISGSVEEVLAALPDMVREKSPGAEA